MQVQVHNPDNGERAWQDDLAQPASVETEEEEEAVVDILQLDPYLLPVPMRRHWQPLTTHVMVRQHCHGCAVSCMASHFHSSM